MEKLYCGTNGDDCGSISMQIRLLAYVFTGLTAESFEKTPKGEWLGVLR